MIDDIAYNAEGFRKQLTELGELLEDSMTTVIRKTCFDLYKRIKQDTPIDTGLARANWSIQAKAPDMSVYDSTSREVQESDFKFTFKDEEIWLSNNLEYIEALEDGHSKQEPQGMVAVNLAEFDVRMQIFIRQIKEGLEPA